MKYKIPQVEIEIGENLFLRIEDVSFEPFRPGYISGLPEDCYSAEPAEADWKTENAKLIVKKQKCIWNTVKLKVDHKDEEIVFTCPLGLDQEYYFDIIEEIEERSE